MSDGCSEIKTATKLRRQINFCGDQNKRNECETVSLMLSNTNKLLKVLLKLIGRGISIRGLIR
jgi:hypothetical protein